MNPVRIAIVEDHVILREGIISILNKQRDFEVVGEAGSVAGALKLAQDSRPDLILMDFGLPDGNGVEATKKILAAYPETNVVFLTMHEEDDLLFAAVRSGAKGYLLKNISAEQMLGKLRDLAGGDAAFLPAQTRQILAEFARTDSSEPVVEELTIPLTARELEVLRLLVKDASNQEIGRQLHISVHTVKNHVHNILDKLNVSNRRQAADVAVKRRLVASVNR